MPFYCGLKSFLACAATSTNIIPTPYPSRPLGTVDDSTLLQTSFFVFARYLHHHQNEVVASATGASFRKDRLFTCQSSPNSTILPISSRERQYHKRRLFRFQRLLQPLRTHHPNPNVKILRAVKQSIAHPHVLSPPNYRPPFDYLTGAVNFSTSWLKEERKCVSSTGPLASMATAMAMALGKAVRVVAMARAMLVPRKSVVQ